MYVGSGGSSATGKSPGMVALRCGERRLSKKWLLLLPLLLLPPCPTSCRDIVVLYAVVAGAAVELGGGCCHAGGETECPATKPGATGCCLSGTVPVWLKVGNGSLYLGRAAVEPSRCCSAAEGV